MNPGRFDKGNAAWRASAATQFKSGGPAPNARPVGSEYVCRQNGDVLVYVPDDRPTARHARRIVRKQRLRWEREHGPIPSGMVLICKGNDKTDSNPSNWECVPSGLTTALVKRGYYADIPAELKAAIMLVAKLNFELYRRNRGHRIG